LPYIISLIIQIDDLQYLIDELQDNSPTIAISNAIKSLATEIEELKSLSSQNDSMKKVTIIP